MNRIPVPPGFLADFDLYCERSRMNRWEADDFRHVVRANYDAWAPVIRRAAAVYRFVDETWGPTLGKGRMPTAALCEGYMASHGYFMDPSAAKCCALGLLLDKCAELAGVIDQPAPV